MMLAAVGIAIFLLVAQTRAQCPPLTDICMTEENERECQALVDDGCQNLLFLESCPLQFACGDPPEQVTCPTLTGPCMDEDSLSQCRSLVDGGCENIEVMESCPVQFVCDGDVENEPAETTKPPAPSGSCGDCFCIPQPGEQCPSPAPETDFSALLPELSSLTHLNRLELSCDPYQTNATDPPCDTRPKLEEGEVCVIILDNVTECPDASYTLKTTSAQEAADNNWLITHYEPCGTCSSMQDLMVYMAYPDLTNEGTICGAIAVASERLGLKCFRDLGMSEDCARIWLFNTVNTRNDCGRVCTAFTLAGRPNNGPSPTCALDECLVCDEEQSGPNFQRFAGRTRRRSGLISAIARGCDELIPLNQMSPCEYYQQVAEETSKSNRRLAAALALVIPLVIGTIV